MGLRAAFGIGLGLVVQGLQAVDPVQNIPWYRLLWKDSGPRQTKRKEKLKDRRETSKPESPEERLEKDRRERERRAEVENERLRQKAEIAKHQEMREKHRREREIQDEQERRERQRRERQRRERQRREVRRRVQAMVLSIGLIGIIVIILSCLLLQLGVWETTVIVVQLFGLIAIIPLFWLLWRMAGAFSGR